MTIKHLQFDDSGSVAYGALTTSYQTVLSMTDDADFLFIYNTTDSLLYVKIPSGSATTKELIFPGGSTIAIDCRTNSKRIAKGNIQVKYSGTAPTSGVVIVTVAR